MHEAQTTVNNQVYAIFSKLAHVTHNTLLIKWSKGVLIMTELADLRL